ncbi:PDZ and LIM domain protein Zasp isoform X2 [Nasonia vitripennis]|uniref:PDZ and LIM domain protein Zasp n=1 Tax=Nasonia vitripennis TaxID=7425 RepID=A0A7M7Q3Z9_NASVI|nr:PDZ and LIM domain protein Zasp isoform X2 [Nasonia vitripennis]
MAQLISVKLSRFDGSPWGFRLQGGKDFGTPLIVQKVNNGSPAEAAGLRAGDAVIRVNSTDMFNLRHKDAQDVIVRAGNNFELTVQRGGSTWRPSVSPVTASIPSPQPTAPASSISPVTKTSLAAKKQEVHLIGSGHNFSPKPFLNGTSDGTVKSIVNKQYNSPVGIYSEETIAETLSAQAEVLAGGVLGVNFKKNEKNYNAQNSEVFKMVQEADKEPRTPEPVPARTEFYSSVSHAVGGRSTSPRSPTPLSAELGITQPPVYPTRPAQKLVQQQQQQPATRNAAPRPDGVVICSNCDSAIVGVFVRIKEKNLHVECFKCSTCGTSLKNVGYYNINNKLYCDIHAKLVARQNAPAGMVPVTVGPGQKAPANTISAALSNVGPLSPALSNHGSSSPQSFSTSYARAYSPDTRYRNAYNNGFSSGSSINNGYEQQRPESNNSYDNSNGYESSKTYTSTLTIQTSQQQQQQQQQNNGQDTREKLQQSPELDYNRNPTNDQFNNLDNKLHKLTDDIRDFAFDEQKQQSKLLTGKDYCDANTVQKPMLLRAFKAPTNNLAGPKPFIGSSLSNQNYSSSPIINTGNSTLPRPQNQSVTGAGSCGLGGGNKGGTFAGSSAPNRGRGILNQAGSGLRVPLCAACNSQVRGPFISALGQIWCPEHFVCVNPQCRRGLQDIGFVEEKGQLYCEYCFERFIAPSCNKCNNKIKGDCLNAIGKHFHPECFNCAHCGKHFGNSPFFLEEGLPYCERDWNDLFTTKCFACGFPVEAGDRWVEALNNNYHSQCFNCTMCKKNLEGQSFYAKGGRPFCKNHAR